MYITAPSVHQDHLHALESNLSTNGLPKKFKIDYIKANETYASSNLNTRSVVSALQYLERI